MIALIVLGIIVLLLTVAALMELTGRLSRQEERNALARCPWCGVPPQLGYACGEYFIHGNDPDCPYCGTAFTEMHSDPRMEIDAWNRRVEDVYSSVYKEVQSAIRNPEMYQGKTRKE